MAGSRIKLLPGAWLVVLLPVITIHLCWAISTIEGYVDPCFPYWAECHSISKSGRYGAAYFVFKGGMIPFAVLIFFFWQLNRSWLAMLGREHHRSLLWLALVGSIALLLYTLSLGHAGDTFRSLRRFGVILFMFCTFSAQVKLGRELLHSPQYALQGRQLLKLSAATLAIAIFSLLLDFWLGKDYDRVENAFEWWLMLLLHVHSFYVVYLWKVSGFSLQAALSKAVK